MKVCSVRETAEILAKAQSFILTSHINPDGDALGSLLGLGLSLEQLGKQVEFLIDDEVPAQYSFLPGAEKIRRPEENKIGKADILVVLDASDLERIGRVAELYEAESVLNIDHHVSNSGLGDFQLLDIKAAATCEIVFEIISALQVKVDKNIALPLYTGIVSDCGFFRYANTTPKTMRIAADLLYTGIEPNEISDQLETQSIESLRILPKILETLEFFCGGKIAAITIPHDLYSSKMDSEAYIKYPRYILGVEVAILFKGVTNELTRVSMRSRQLDVSVIAEEFGGGGHVRAAGCTIYGDTEKAKQSIIKALAKPLGVKA